MASGGKRADLGGQFFRSSWEANYARYLNWLIASFPGSAPDDWGGILKWEFESEEFEFTKIKRGTRFYKPDFKVYLKGGAIEYHEVKGYQHQKGETALKRMAKYYPEVKIVLIDKDWFRAVNRQGLPAMIEHWEGGKRDMSDITPEKLEQQKWR